MQAFSVRILSAAALLLLLPVFLLVWLLAVRLSAKTDAARPA